MSKRFIITLAAACGVFLVGVGVLVGLVVPPSTRQAAAPVRDKPWGPRTLDDSEKADLYATVTGIHGYSAENTYDVPSGLWSYSSEDKIAFATAAAAITPDLWGLRPGEPAASRMGDRDRAAILNALAHGHPPDNTWLLESRRVILAWSDALPDVAANLFSMNCRLAGDQIAAGTWPGEPIERWGWDIQATPLDLYEIAYNTGHSESHRRIAVSRYVERIREEYDAGLRLMGQDPANYDDGRRRLDWVDSHDWRLDVERRRAYGRID
jgi:hypothetical protein